MWVNVVLDCPPGREKKVRYVFTTLLDTLGCPYRFVTRADWNPSPKELSIVYGPSADKPENNRPPTLYLQAEFADFDPPLLVRRLLFGDEILPILGKCTPPGFSAGDPLFSCADTGGKRWPAVTEFRRAGGASIRVHFDLIASAFFFLSRLEEQHTPDRDRHERFPSAAAWAVREGFADRPIVNEYLTLLRMLLVRLATQSGVPLVFKGFWPNGKEVAVCLTHDVDVLSGWFLYTLVRLAELLRKGHWGAAFQMFRQSLGKIFQPLYPLQILVEMAQQEKARNIHSSYYFLSGTPSWRGFLKSDITYNNRAEPIAAVLRDLSAQGFEVGLHGSYDSFQNAAQLVEEKRRLEEIAGQPVIGIRQHFLRFAAPDTWRVQEKAGFFYDTTLGFAEQPGFRAGFGFPFYPYDLKQDEPIPLLELPLVLMDRSYSKYQTASNAALMDSLDGFLKVLKKPGGLLTLLWHTHMADEFGFFDYPQLYQRILDRVLEEECYVASGRDIYTWWEARRKVVALDTRNEGSRKLSWKFRFPVSMEGLSFKIFLPGNPSAFSVEVLDCRTTIRKGTDSLEIYLESVASGQEITIFLKENRA